MKKYDSKNLYLAFFNKVTDINEDPNLFEDKYILMPSAEVKIVELLKRKKNYRYRNVFNNETYTDNAISNLEKGEEIVSKLISIKHFVKADIISDSQLETILSFVNIELKRFNEAIEKNNLKVKIELLGKPFDLGMSNSNENNNHQRPPKNETPNKTNLNIKKQRRKILKFPR